jgi:hypothetical protein
VAGAAIPCSLASVMHEKSIHIAPEHLPTSLAKALPRHPKAVPDMRWMGSTTACHRQVNKSFNFQG